MPILDLLRDPDSFQYQISSKTGSVAAGAATKLIFYARNASTSKLAHILHLKMNGVIATTAFAAGQVLYEAFIARGFSAENGTPGGTALTITGENARLKTSFDTTALSVVRIASTAALAAPTWTLDAQPFGQLNSHSSAGVNAATPIIGSQYLPNDGELFKADIANGDWPIVLGANEGVAIQVTVPATGVWIAGVTMKWAETHVAI